MASLSPAKHIIKVLNPEQTSKALAEWVAVHGGMELDDMCHVKVEWCFDVGAKTFKQCRVEVRVA